MITRLTILLLNLIIKRTIKKRNAFNNTSSNDIIIKQAYNNMIKNLKDSVMFLTAIKNKK